MEVAVMVKISVLALTAVLFLGLTAPALAGNSFNFLGETTWTVTIAESFPDPPPPFTITMRGGISKLGPNNYYLFQGVVQLPPEAQDKPFFLSGGGTLVSMPGAQTSTLVLTLNTSQLHVDAGDSSNRDTGVMHVEINPSNLSGTFYEVGHDFDRVHHQFSERFTAGSLSTTAPFPLNPSATGSLGLLLD
jgi:hypothetical protein